MGEEMPLIFSQAKFEDSGFDFAEEGYDFDLAEEELAEEEEKPVFNYAKYAMKKNSESVDFAEEEEEMPLIFSQAKFEDSGIDFAEEGYDFDLAEEEEKPVFNYAKYAIKKNSESVDFAEEESVDFAESEDIALAEEDMPLIFSQAKFEDSAIDLAEEQSDMFNYKKYALP